MSHSNLMHRRDVVATLLKDRGGLVAVGGLGASTYDMAAAGDHRLNVYLWGAMGGAAMIGLGLALARPDRPVLVITGDGEMLMGVGAFAAIAMQAPPNLGVVILDNGRYGETGGQESATARTADLAAVARGFGIADSGHLTGLDEVAAFAAAMQRPTGTRLRVARIDPEDLPRVLPTRDGAEIRLRVQHALAEA